MENAALRENNKKQEAQILELQNQVQGEKKYTPVHTVCVLWLGVRRHVFVCVCVLLSPGAEEFRWTRSPQQTGGGPAPQQPDLWMFPGEREEPSGSHRPHPLPEDTQHPGGE